MDKKILHRLKIAKGHLAKVVKMAESDVYCIDILTQSQAVQSALRKIDSLILENHLRTCVADALTSKNKDSAIKEVIKVFEKK